MHRVYCVYCVYCACDMYRFSRVHQIAGRLEYQRRVDQVCLRVVSLLWPLQHAVTMPCHVLLLGAASANQTFRGLLRNCNSYLVKLLAPHHGSKMLRENGLVQL